MYRCKLLLLFFILHFGIYVIANAATPTKRAVQTKKQEMEARQRILDKIKAIFTQNTLPHNTISPDKIQCMLTPTQRKSIVFNHADNITFEYQNILLELKANKQPSKVAQDLLMNAARDGNMPSLLLASQLYFLKKCERCEKARALSSFDYYRTSSTTPSQFLAIEGGKFLQSYVVRGEAMLCNALENRKAQDFFMAYIYLMLADNHTRAINALLMGISQSNASILFETFKFLASNDIVIAKNTNAVFLLEALSLQEKGSNFSNIALLPQFQNLKVLENAENSNVVLTLFLIRDMDIGRILSPLHKLANTTTLQEFFSKQKYYENILQTSNLKILEKATLKDLQEYYKILEFKQKLKQIPTYPYATTYSFTKY